MTYDKMDHSRRPDISEQKVNLVSFWYYWVSDPIIQSVLTSFKIALLPEYICNASSSKHASHSFHEHYESFLL